MILMRLDRIGYFPWATFGWLYLPDGSRLATVEPPWKDNHVGESCIPEGVYPLRPCRFNRGGYDTWGIPNGTELLGNRTEIKIHRANRARELRGCIAPGLDFGTIGREWGVMSSTQAHLRLMASLSGLDYLDLEITHYHPDGVAPPPTRPIL